MSQYDDILVCVYTMSNDWIRQQILHLTYLVFIMKILRSLVAIFKHMVHYYLLWSQCRGYLKSDPLSDWTIVASRWLFCLPRLSCEVDPLLSPHCQVPKNPSVHLLHVQISGSALWSQFAKLELDPELFPRLKQCWKSLLWWLCFAFICTQYKVSIWKKSHINIA